MSYGFIPEKYLEPDFDEYMGEINVTKNADGTFNVSLGSLSWTNLVPQPDPEYSDTAQRQARLLLVEIDSSTYSVCINLLKC